VPFNDQSEHVVSRVDDDEADPATVTVEPQPVPEPDQPFTGSVLIQLYDEDGNIKHEQRGGNLITDAGDLYYAGMAIALVTPAAPAQPTKMTGMKLGTGSTAVAKAGAGAALVTYLSASNLAFDATFPVTSNLGAGLGVVGQYKTTWGAGVATNAAITEAVIVNDAGTNATSTAANTAHRIVFTAINKGASDTLVITWNAKFLGV
jgi:hypothetical protein